MRAARVFRVPCAAAAAPPLARARARPHGRATALFVQRSRAARSLPAALLALNLAVVRGGRGAVQARLVLGGAVASALQEKGKQAHGQR
jgi:hypothetical protein